MTPHTTHHVIWWITFSPGAGKPFGLTEKASTTRNPPLDERYSDSCERWRVKNAFFYQETVFTLFCYCASSFSRRTALNKQFLEMLEVLNIIALEWSWFDTIAAVESKRHPCIRCTGVLSSAPNEKVMTFLWVASLAAHQSLGDLSIGNTIYPGNFLWISAKMFIVKLVTAMGVESNCRFFFFKIY